MQSVDTTLWSEFISMNLTQELQRMCVNCIFIKSVKVYHTLNLCFEI